MLVVVQQPSKQGVTALDVRQAVQYSGPTRVSARQRARVLLCFCGLHLMRCSCEPQTSKLLNRCCSKLPLAWSCTTTEYHRISAPFKTNASRGLDQNGMPIRNAGVGHRPKLQDGSTPTLQWPQFSSGTGTSGQPP
jgi:hypothetical protein